MKFFKHLLIYTALLAAVSASAQYGAGYGTFPGVPARIATVTRTNVNSIVAIPGGSTGFSMGAVMTSTNSSVSNVVFGISFSFDGVNFTGEKFQLVQPLSDTTVSVGFTNWTKDTFGSPAYVRLNYITNSHTASLFVSNVWFNTR